MEARAEPKRHRKTRAELIRDNAQAARIQLYLPVLEARRKRMAEDLKELDRLIKDEREAERNLRVASYLETDAP